MYQWRLSIVSICMNFSIASSAFGKTSRDTCSPRNTIGNHEVQKKYQLFRSLFKEHIYLHYFLRILHVENLSRMSAALGQPRYYIYSRPYAVPRLHKSTKQITYEVRVLSPGQWPTLTVTIILMIISFLIYYMHYISKLKISSTRSKKNLSYIKYTWRMHNIYMN